jgi:glycosyltransferase involved in cell wall biosynthesis
MGLPRVSVIIPTYDSGPLLTDAVESVLAQTVVPSEIIVVDDGSRDDTRKRLEAYAGRIKSVFQENQGVAAARNHGIRLAQGDLVAFLDADDVWHPRKLEFQTSVMDERPEIGLLGTRVFDWPHGDFPDVGAASELTVSQVTREQLIVKNYFSTSSVIVRRTVLQRAGPFDVQLQGPEDYDLWLRISEVSACANLQLPLMGYRSSGDGLSHRVEAMERGMNRIYRKLEDKGVWGGKPWLRRKAYSFMHYQSSLVHRAAGRHWQSARSLLRSLTLYPFPYRRGEVKTSFPRTKGLVISFLRFLQSWRENLPPSRFARASDRAA